MRTQGFGTQGTRPAPPGAAGRPSNSKSRIFSFVPVATADLIETVVAIGYHTGTEGDKFERFGLRPTKASKVAAPLVAECYANVECMLADASQIDRHGLFIWDVVKAHVATSPKRPQTLHYRDGGEFMVSGSHVSRRAEFLPDNP